MDVNNNDAPKLENADYSSRIVKQAIPATQPKGGIVQIQRDRDPAAQTLSERTRLRRETKYFGTNLVKLGLTIFSIPFTIVGIPYAAYLLINGAFSSRINLNGVQIDRELLPLPVGLSALCSLLVVVGLVMMLVGIQEANRSTTQVKNERSGR